MDEVGVVQVVIKGADDKQVPLLAVADAFKEFHQIVDKSYLSLSGRNKLSKTDRELYKIVTTNIKSGSVIAELFIVVPPLVQSAFYFHSTGLNVKNLWELTKNSFNFLKILASGKNDGQKITISQHADPYGFNFANIGGGNLTVNVGTLVQQNTSRSEEHIKKLSKIIDDKNVASFSALDQTGDGIILTPKENKLFNPETVMDKNPIELIGKIFRLDVENRTGRMRVLQGEYQGEYPFQIVGGQKLSVYIHALEQEYSKITALKEIIKHPTGDETLAGFQLVDIMHILKRGQFFE